MHNSCLWNQETWPARFHHGLENMTAGCSGISMQLDPSSPRPLEQMRTRARLHCHTSRLGWAVTPTYMLGLRLLRSPHVSRLGMACPIPHPHMHLDQGCCIPHPPHTSGPGLFHPNPLHTSGMGLLCHPVPWMSRPGLGCFPCTPPFINLD